MGCGAWNYRSRRPHLGHRGERGGIGCWQPGHFDQFDRPNATTTSSRITTMVAHDATKAIKIRSNHMYQVYQIAASTMGNSPDRTPAGSKSVEDRS